MPSMSADPWVREESHRQAQLRRDQGRPIWDFVVYLGDIWRNEAMTFEEWRDAVIQRLRESDWGKHWNGNGGPLDRLVDFDLTFSIDKEEFFDAWSEVLDRADVGDGGGRAFIDTVSKP